MLALSQISANRGIFIVLLASLTISGINDCLAQDRLVQGTVRNSMDLPVAGASVIIRENKNGTVTDSLGHFSLKVIDQKDFTLTISSVGYASREIHVESRAIESPLSVRLDEQINLLNEIIITGVFDRATSIASSIAITSIPTEQLNNMIPNSASELLRMVPGVFVNSSKGEVSNSVYSRGMILNEGYYYVSMQEDGLPIIPITGAFSPDGFLRSDINLKRVEAVRGGSAAVLSANAPGGIFNYISKSGTSKFAAEFRSRVGLEGNGKNPYYRAELGFGGPFSKTDKTWTYYVGGHYRYANGAKYPGYPLSRGGQIKGNIQKQYKHGSIRVNLKYLHDRTDPFENTPSVDFNHPRPADGFSNTSSVLVQSVKLHLPYLTTGLRDIDYDSRKLTLFKEFATGLNWEHEIGDGWTLQNAFKYSDKTSLENKTIIVFPWSVDKPEFYFFQGLVGAGVYRFYNPKTLEGYGTVTISPDFTLNSDLHLPGNSVAPNSLFINPIHYTSGRMRDVMDQFSITKQFETMRFTAGVFYASTVFNRQFNGGAGSGYATIENRPQLVGLEFTPSDAPPGTRPQQFTDPNGIAQYGFSGMSQEQFKVKQSAVFFGHNWNITDRLTLDWGFRLDRMALAYHYITAGEPITSKNGLDNDSTTLYDNISRGAGDPGSYNNVVTNYSLTGGLNFRLNHNVAFYTRYALGKRAPDLSFYLGNVGTVDTLDVESQRTIQIELGMKLYIKKHTLFITPFYSGLDKVPNFQSGMTASSQYYAVPKLYNKLHTIGIEIEGNYIINTNLSVRASGVIQQFYADRYRFYDLKGTGSADDSVVDRSGKKISDQAPPIMINVTPTYTYSNFYGSVNWYFLSKRAANTSETFYLPAFSQFDINLGYNISKNLQVQLSINNLFNTYGVMSWNAPTPSGIPYQAFGQQQFTPEARAANPNAVYSTIAIQARSYFLSLNLKF